MSNIKTKITEPGQLCGHCSIPVIKRIPRTRPRGKRKYYYEYFLFCPQCKRNYMVESAMRFWEENTEKSFQQKYPNQDGVSQATEKKSKERLWPGGSQSAAIEAKKDGVTPQQYNLP